MSRKYELSEIDREELTNRFRYHPPKLDQPDRYVEIRTAGRRLAELICEVCPGSRERAVSLTKVEEAVMWANASIARNE